MEYICVFILRLTKPNCESSAVQLPLIYVGKIYADMYIFTVTQFILNIARIKQTDHFRYFF